MINKISIPLKKIEVTKFGFFFSLKNLYRRIVKSWQILQDEVAKNGHASDPASLHPDRPFTTIQTNETDSFYPFRSTLTSPVVLFHYCPFSLLGQRNPRPWRRLQQEGDRRARDPWRKIVH